MTISTSNTQGPQDSSANRKLTIWKRFKLFLILLCLPGLWMISGVAGLFSSSSPEIRTVDMVPAKDVDEERFLLFLLENHLDRILLSFHQPPEAGTEAAKETKDYALAILAHLQHHPVATKGIERSFQRVVALADAYTAMVVDLDLIDKRAKGPKGQANVQVGASSAALAYGGVQMLDTGDGGALFLGGLAGLVKSWNDSRAEEAEFKAQADRVMKTFLSQVDEARAEAVVLADEVAQKHSWKRKTVGFVRDERSLGQEITVRQPKDLLPILVEHTRQRPLNPILQFQCIMLEDGLDGDATTQQKYLEWSAKFGDLARLVPSGAVYDYYRWRYLMRAGEMALSAAEQEGKGKRLGASSKAAILAASCWKTALSFNETDSGAELRWGYAQSLAWAGKLDESQELLFKIKDHVCLKPGYHYLLARLAAFHNESDQALGHLKNAVEKGLSNLVEARNAPDFEGLRNNRSQAFDAVFVKYEWNVKYGVFNDDVTLTNQSPFPLTHLVLRPVISNSNGSFTPKQQLTLEKLDPGQSHTWVNCVSVSGGGENATRKAELQCDQSSR